MSEPLRASLIAVAVLAASLAPVALGAAPAFSLTRADPALYEVSPGEIVTFRATLTNGGAATETYDIALTGDRHFAFSTSSLVVTLAPGASTVVSYDVEAPDGWYYGEFQLRATPQSAPSSFRYLISAVEIPVLLTVKMNNTRLSPTGQDVTGTVTAKHLDGSPYAGALATVRAQGSLPADLARLPGSTGTATTGADGVGHFNLGDGPVDRTPGRHYVSATVPRPGASAVVSAEASYNILT